MLLSPQTTKERDNNQPHHKKGELNEPRRTTVFGHASVF